MSPPNPHPGRDRLPLELLQWHRDYAATSTGIKPQQPGALGNKHGISVAPPQPHALSPLHVLNSGTQHELRTGQSAVVWDMMAHDGAQPGTGAMLRTGDTRELFGDFAAQEMTTHHPTCYFPSTQNPQGRDKD